MLKFVLLFSSVGFAIPILYEIKHLVIDKMRGFEMFFELAESLLPFLWPSCIIMMATNEENIPESILIFAISALVNTFLYASVGSLIWLGLYKNKIFLVVAILSVLAIWYRMYTL
jgi:hypothetical protein